MARYFFDCEFIEGFHKPLFGKRRHFIDLISIGIACEDGRVYYAISNEFNPKDANEWVRQNVFLPMVGNAIVDGTSNERELIRVKGNNIGAIQKIYGKSNKQIAIDIINFIYPESPYFDIRIDTQIRSDGKYTDKKYLNPSFYAYYADYDWVLFCSLFGRMIDLPRGFPMHCIDLKQTLDERAVSNNRFNSFKGQSAIEFLKGHADYPQQTNEHNALADAKWNYELYKFLQTI